MARSYWLQWRPELNDTDAEGGVDFSLAFSGCLREALRLDARQQARRPPRWFRAQMDSSQTARQDSRQREGKGEQQQQHGRAGWLVIHRGKPHGQPPTGSHFSLVGFPSRALFQLDHCHTVTS